MISNKVMKIFMIIFLAFMHSRMYASTIDNETLIFNGEINKKSYLEISQFLKKGGKRIIINSGGGDTRYGQKIGMEFFDNDVTLIVDKYCLSSCANYLFLGAKEKLIQPNGILGFHGGVGIKIIKSKKIASSILLDLNTLIKNEKLFFEKIKVNYELINSSVPLTRSEVSFIDVEIEGKKNIKQTFNGNQEKLASDLIAKSLAEDPKAKFNMTMRNEIENTAYFPSEKTLLKYGVKGIEHYSYPENQVELNAMVKNLYEDLKVVGDFKIEETVKK